MPLGVCLRETTHRQYRTWTAWLDMQWNRPTRSDYLLMRIAQAIYQIPSLLFGRRGDADRVKLEDMRVQFEDPYAEPKPKMTAEEYSAAAKQRWFWLLGMSGEKKD